MSEHVGNGNLVTVARNLGNGVKDAIKRLSEASSGGDSPDQSQWSSPNHALQNQRIHPQISIEHFGDDTETSSKESTPCPEPPPPSEQLTVQTKKRKSYSLPAGLLLDESFRNSDEMTSDLSDDLETTIELDSSLDFEKDLLSVTTTTSPTAKRASPVLKKQLKHTDSSNSTHSIMESDMSSDEENYLGGNKGLDDEVFNDAGYSKMFDTDLKLIEWADKEFVPSCQALLQYCSEGCEKSEQIKTQLKDLSNRIIYFSSEQQRLSVQLRSLNLRSGITASLSTDQFNRFSTMTDKSSQSHTNQPTSPDSSGSPSVSGRESGESQYDHRSYAVKVLRSVSKELIEPLLRDAADFAFAAELYQAIVQAIQKIAWKVEACLSFNDPTKHFLIYHNIFTTSVTERVQSMMIRASPSTNHTRQSNNASSSISEESSSPQRSNSIETIDPQRVIKRTPSGRIRPAGTVFNSDTIPDDFKVGVSNGDTSPIPTINESLSAEGTPTVNSAETTPRLFRSRTATAGDTDSMGSWKSRHLSSKFGSSSFLDEAGFPVPMDFAPDYLRPTKPRRTTVSLSRNEVTSLGLTVAKRVDETIISDMSNPLLRQHCSNNEEEEQRVRERLHAKLTETFKKIREATPPQCPFDRKKSASMSDILDDAPPTSLAIRRRDSETRKQSLEVEDVISPGPYSPTYTPTYTRSFITLPPQSCDDWVYLKEPAVDARVCRDSPTKKLKSPPKSSKEKKVKKQRKASEKKDSEKKKSVENKISTSGRFTVSLRKTAQALRRMSTSVPKSRESMTTEVEVGSLERLSEVSKEPSSRPISSLSEPASPITKSRVHTMPSNKRKITTFFKSGKPQSKSFSKADTLTRKRKVQRSGFLAAYQDSSSGGGYGESIDLLYSDKVDLETSVVQGEAEKDLLVTVGVAGKQPTKGKKLSTSNGWFEITVTTNIKQFGRNHYTILRTVKQAQNLFDELQTSHSLKFPERPDKKKDSRKQSQQIEDFLRFVSGSSHLRESTPLVMFLMPDDQFGTFTDNGSEVNFELIMTFYTPDHYPGPPGSHRNVEEVLPEDTPNSSPPARPRKGGTLKRGTMRVIKNEEEGATFIIREEEQDALIVACEDDRYVVVAGTFEKLVEQLAGDEKPDQRFVSTLLIGYRHFATPVELLTGLLRRFHLELPPNATDEEIVYAEKWRYMIQLRVLDILTYWIKKCWPDFYRHQEVLDLTNQFIGDLKSAKDPNFNLAGTNLERTVAEKSEASPRIYKLGTPGTPRTPRTPTCTPSTPTTPTRTPSTPTSPRRGTVLATPTSTPTSPRRGTVLATPPSTPSTRGESSSPSPRVGGRSRSRQPVDISTLTAIQLARQLTLIELDFLKLVTTHELAVYTWEQNTPENKPYRKNLDNFIARFNKVSYWVASEICSLKDAKSRAALIEKFIEIAKQCQEHRNFNTTVSLVTGLSLAAVRRLKKSWEFVGEKSVKAYQKLTLVTSPTSNHGNYRKLLSAVHRRESGIPYGCIPYFGVFVRDLVFFNDGNAKKLKNGLINFSKLRTMVLKFEELKRYQRSKYFFPPEDRTRDFCKNLWSLSESDLYEVSLQVEPREAPPIETDV